MDYPRKFFVRGMCLFYYIVMERNHDEKSGFGLPLVLF